jgi:hypothetical protein
MPNLEWLVGNLVKVDGDIYRWKYVFHFSPIEPAEIEIVSCNHIGCMEDLYVRYDCAANIADKVNAILVDEFYGALDSFNNG